MLYRNGQRGDVEGIARLSRKEAKKDIPVDKVLSDIEKNPSEVAEDEKGLLGFALSEEIGTDILLVYSLVVRNEQRCDPVGRRLLELVESQAADRGYYGIVVSAFVQKALLGCAGDAITFAGYQKIYDTGSSRLLARCLS